MILQVQYGERREITKLRRNAASKLIRKKGPRAKRINNENTVRWTSKKDHHIIKKSWQENDPQTGSGRVSPPLRYSERTKRTAE